MIIWVAQMAAAFYFCVQKQGFHEDEYYTYYSTARTGGFYVEDGQWMDRDAYRNEFVVLPGQQFQYGLVKQVQSWDVHPPMYYWVFHTLASLFPGIFSKWIGLSVNLFFFGVNQALLTYLSYLVCGRHARTALLATLFFGFSPAAVSGVVFIRMYEMLTAAVLLCGVLHVQAMGKDGERLSVMKTLLPMAAVTYVGFLTQYYYFIFVFYLGIAFCIWLFIRDANLWNCIRYGVSQGIAFVLAYLTYPSCLGQMFRGQRGAQAAENFFDWSNTVMRFGFFYDLLDEYVFGRMLPVFLLLILVLFVTVYRKRGRRVNSCQGAQGGFSQKGQALPAFWAMAFAALGYFLTVSKTALLLGGTSNRYQLPVYGIMVLLVFCVIQILWQRAACLKEKRPSGFRFGSRAPYFSEKWKGAMTAAAAAACLLIDAAGLMSNKVVFLYPEDYAQVAYAEKMAKEGVPAVYLYQPGAQWCIWDVSNELFAYPAVYFLEAEGDSAIEDPQIQAADRLVVYLAKGADVKAQADRIRESSPQLSECLRVFEEKYCDVYYFGK